MRYTCFLNVIYTIPQACKNYVNRNTIHLILEGADHVFVQSVTLQTPDTVSWLITVGGDSLNYVAGGSDEIFFPTINLFPKLDVLHFTVLKLSNIVLSAYILVK